MTSHKILVSSALCSMLLLSTPAVAQYGEGADIQPYVTFSMGLALTPNLESSSFDPEPVSLFTDSGPNLTVGGGIGAVSGYTRHELRVDYHRAKVDGVTNVPQIYDRPCFIPFPPGGFECPGVPVTQVDPSGSTIGVTTLLYTIALRHTFLDDKLAVYGGIGIGAAYGVIPIGGLTIEDWQFGYSFGTGVFYEIWRGIGLDFGYRNVRATDFSGSAFVPVQPAAKEFGDGEFPFLVSWSAHELVLSVRYAWGGRD